jgi:hypothetical protein
MATCSDGKGTTVLMVSYNFENFTRLYQLPQFEPRGYLIDVSVLKPLIDKLLAF